MWYAHGDWEGNGRSNFLSMFIDLQLGQAITSSIAPPSLCTPSILGVLNCSGRSIIGGGQVYVPGMAQDVRGRPGRAPARRPARPGGGGRARGRPAQCWERRVPPAAAPTAAAPPAAPPSMLAAVYARPQTGRHRPPARALPVPHQRRHAVTHMPHTEAAGGVKTASAFVSILLSHP